MGKDYTFSELDNRGNRLANGLMEMGVQKGERVGILLQNCVEFIEIDFALSKTGIVPSEDILSLKRMGVKEVFLPGTSLKTIVAYFSNIQSNRKHWRSDGSGTLEL